MQKQLSALEIYNLKSVPKVQPKRKRSIPVSDIAPEVSTVSYTCTVCHKFVRLSSESDIKCHHCESRMVFKIKQQSQKKIPAI